MNEYTAMVITVSDKGAKGERTDTSGPAVGKMLEEAGFTVTEYLMVPDETEKITGALVKASFDSKVCLAVTTGGTGFSKRDVTPEATMAVVDRPTPGIAEAMRAESMKVTPRGMLSRGVAGIRNDTLIINLPGSEKAAKECLAAVLPALKHGIEMLRGWSGECASHHHH